LPSECFTPMNLTEPIKMDEHFDLALCLEVAEHLPSRTSAQLVRGLTDLAPIALFSAAVPGQGGTGHVNEQWPEYWRNLFKERGFAMLDPIRPLLREDHRVEICYLTSSPLYARPSSNVFLCLIVAVESERRYRRVRSASQAWYRWRTGTRGCPQ
jgi:hypothetical protein